MYESPIKIIESAIDSFSKSLIKQKEDAIIFEVQRSLGVDVDRGELLQALQYDRFQYDKGYADGKADAMAELVRCKDCEYYVTAPYYALACDQPKDTKICRSPNLDYDTECGDQWMWMTPDDFCSCGVRRCDK